MLSVAKQFNRAAKGYTQVAQLQRQVTSHLATLLPHDLSPRWILDLGAGTSSARQMLNEAYPEASYLAVDLALQMLKQGQQIAGSRLCADAHRLAIEENSIDLCFSSLMLQWCDADLVLSELQRVMRAQGYVLFSTFGPETLSELRAMWRLIDNYAHVNDFRTASSLREIMTSTWSTQHWQTVRVTRWYPGLDALLYELKALGANHVLAGRAPGLLSRIRWQRLKRYYQEHYQTARGIPATFEIFYGVLQKK